jgi:hypothetical protein
VQEVRTDQAALFHRECRMRSERALHFDGTIFEHLQQIAVPAEKIVEHIGKHTGHGGRVHAEHPLDDVIGPCFVRRVEIARLGGRFEGADHHASGIRTQVEGLSVEKCSLRQKTPGR